MRRTVITATDNEYAPLLIEREELTEDGWQRRSLAIAELILTTGHAPILYAEDEFPFRFISHRFLIEERKDDEGQS